MPGTAVQVGDRWRLFHHDSQQPGKNHLRNVKVTPLTFDSDGTIRMVDPFVR